MSAQERPAFIVRIRGLAVPSVTTNADLQIVEAVPGHRTGVLDIEIV
jgi:hypothetical protein